MDSASKSILCYGDSLTWGSVPGEGRRHARTDRWPGVLAQALGPDVDVIVDALRGRTTAFDDLTADCDRNGVRTLPTALFAHAPLDLVILMLGVNDLKPHVAGRAVATLSGMRRLVEIVRTHSPRTGEGAPDVLIVAPPRVVATDDLVMAGLFRGADEQSEMLASLYRDLADEMECGFFDAGGVATASPVDGVHLDAEATRAIGRALAPVVRVMLGL